MLIETGRHKNIPRDQRICPMCKLQFGQNSDIEDEYHFILICPTYRDLRKKFIKKYYWSNLSVYKFVQLLSANNVCAEIYVTWANILRKHLKKDLLTSSTYMYNCYIYWCIVLIFSNSLSPVYFKPMNVTANCMYAIRNKKNWKKIDIIVDNVPGAKPPDEMDQKWQANAVETRQ